MQLGFGTILALWSIGIVSNAPTESTIDVMIEDTTDVILEEQFLDRDTTGLPFEADPIPTPKPQQILGNDDSESRSIGGPVSQMFQKEMLPMFATKPPSPVNFSVAQSMPNPMQPTRSSLFSLAEISKAEEAQSAEDEEENDSVHYDDYDYKQGGLPPSLPNLEIIPFVAADAVVGGASMLDVGSDAREEPPAPVAMPGNSESRAKAPFPQRQDVPSIEPKNVENAEKRSDFEQPDGSCVWNGTHFRNGEFLSKSSPCISCRCQFGDVLCQETQCPPTPKSCTVKTKPNTCCGIVVCESGVTYPTEILNRPPTLLRPLGIHIPSFEAGPTIPSEKIGGANPFRDVIKFQPAPDLKDDEESKKNAFYVFSSTETPDNPVLPIRKNLAGPKVQSGKKHGLPKLSLPPVRNELVPSEFKLGGCNIYGRMYKVNKVVDELSGPCTQCRCTDNGVQCSPLPC